MKESIKKLLLVCLIVISVLSLSACGSTEKVDSDTSTAEDTIKIGIIDDISGNNAVIGIQKIHAYKLAVEEINANGGIMGKQIELIETDSQSDNNKYQELSRKLIFEDKVDVIMAGLTSASREAIRPIMEENKMLYFYNQQYEGGVASHYTFCTGATPEQQILPMMGDLVDQYGGNVYIIAADYNFGQISAKWMKQEVEKAGGQIVGKEFIPLEVSQFSSTISNINNAKPDILISLLVGSAQTSFYEQWGNEGMAGEIPIATTVAIAETYEHKLFNPPALANTYVLGSYIEELDTSAAKEFTEKIYEKFPDDQYMGLDTESCYDAIHLYKLAVEKAGTTDTEGVIKTLESGEISFDGPGGTVTVEPKTHHLTRDMVLFRCDENHQIEVVKTYPAVYSNTFLTDMGIDLTKDAPNQQFEP